MKLSWVTVELHYRCGLEYDLTFHKCFGFFKRRYRKVLPTHSVNKGLWSDLDRHVYVLDSKLYNLLEKTLTDELAKQMKNDKPVIPGVDDDSGYF